MINFDFFEGWGAGIRVSGFELRNWGLGHSGALANAGFAKPLRLAKITITLLSETPLRTIFYHPKIIANLSVKKAQVLYILQNFQLN